MNASRSSWLGEVVGVHALLCCAYAVANQRGAHGSGCQDGTCGVVDLIDGMEEANRELTS